MLLDSDVTYLGQIQFSGLLITGQTPYLLGRFGAG